MAFTAFTKGSETYLSQPNRSTSTPIPWGELDSPCYAECLTDNVNAGNGPWPEVGFMTFTNGSETYLSEPNRSTYTSIPRGRLDYPCYADYLGDNVNADNGPWPEVAFVTFAMGSETCVSQPNCSTSTPLP